MDFAQFLVLLAVSIVVAAILHYPLSYYAVPGTKSFFGKIVIGYIGASLAGSLIGTWELVPGLTVSGVPLIPAILGTLGIIVFAVDICETLGRRT